MLAAQLAALLQNLPQPKFYQFIVGVGGEFNAEKRDLLKEAG